MERGVINEDDIDYIYVSDDTDDGNDEEFDAVLTVKDSSDEESGSSKEIAKKEKEIIKEEHFQCNLCEFKTLTRKQLKNHMDRKHPVETFHCDICDSVFNCKKNLYQHKYRKHMKKNGEKEKEGEHLKCNKGDHKATPKKAMEGHTKTEHINSSINVIAVTLFVQRIPGLKLILESFITL